MSTTAEAPTRLNLPQIVVRDGNPRGDVDLESEAFAELVASIERNGVLQPILVGQPEDGVFPLIAGHRRYFAAERAGLAEIPVLQADYGGDDIRARTAAIAENVNRLDLSPLQEARALEDLRQGLGLTQLEAAEALGKSERWARERERLLALPKVTAAAFDNGAIAGAAAVALEQVAERSPRMAELLATQAETNAAENGPQYGRKGEVAGAIENIVEDLEPEKDGSSPLGCFVNVDEAITYDDCVLSGMSHERLREFKARFVAVEKAIDMPGWYRSGVRPELEQADIDAARAYGCLLELEGFNRWNDPTVFHYMTDAAFFADRVTLMLDRAETEREKAVEQGKAASKRTGKPAGKPTDADRQARKEARETEQKRREKARADNLELGQRTERVFESPDLTLSVEEAKAIAQLALEPNIESIGARLAYADRSLQELEEGAEPKYKLGRDVESTIWAALEEAKTVPQVWGLLMRVIVTADLVDPAVVTESKQAHWNIPGLFEPAEDPLSKLPKRIRDIAHHRKAIPDAVAARLKREQRDRAAAEKRKAAAYTGSLLEALAASKSPKKSGEVSTRTYERAKKDVFSQYLPPPTVAEMLAKEVKAKRVTAVGEGKDERFEITEKGRKHLEKLQAAELKAQEAGTNG